MIENVYEINEKYNDFINEVFESQVLSEREKSLVTLAIISSFEDEKALKNAILNAKQEFITNEEIGYVISIVMALRSKKILRASLDTFSNNNTVSSCNQVEDDEDNGSVRCC